MNKPKPNVVPGEAAEAARAFVFEHRRSDGIDQREVLARMITEGHGSTFSADVRRKRVKPWALQVLRRLRKYGWLDSPADGTWAPTAALRSCRNSRDLGKRAVRRAEPVRPAFRAPQTESWELIVQEWVFSHREAEFGFAEITVALVQRGFGTGDLGDRLEGARELVEQQLRSLELDGLIQYDSDSELWQATELLREWPEAEG